MKGTEIVSSGELEKRSLTELSAIYNSVSKQKIKKFRDRESAVRRTLAALAEDQKNSPGKTIDKDSLPKPPPKKLEKDKPKLPHGRARKSFNFEVREKIKRHRKGTKRAQLVTLLTIGASYEQVMEKFGWSNRNAYEGIKLLHSKLGYGITETNGIIRLVRE